MCGVLLSICPEWCIMVMQGWYLLGSMGGRFAGGCVVYLQHVKNLLVAIPSLLDLSGCALLFCSVLCLIHVPLPVPLSIFLLPIHIGWVAVGMPVA